MSINVEYLFKPGFDLHADKSETIFGITVGMMVLAVISCILRLVSRRITHLTLWLDDWLIFLALIFTLATCGIVAYCSKNLNFGTHVIATATDKSLNSFLLSLWVLQIFYGIATCFTKLSLLAFYWRAFGGQSLRMALLVTAGVIIAWTIAAMTAGMFSCSPVNAFWDFRKVIGGAKCINEKGYFFATASFNILMDIVILVLPIRVVCSLQMRLSQKIAISTIFLLGAFATVCSGLRLWALTDAFVNGIHSDPTWDLSGSAIWSTIELAVAILCACMPSMRPLLRFILHGSIDKSKESEQPNTFLSRSRAAAVINRRMNTDLYSAPFHSLGTSADETINMEECDFKTNRTHITHNGDDEAGLVKSSDTLSGMSGDTANENHVGYGKDEVWVTQAFNVQSSRRDAEGTQEH